MRKAILSAATCLLMLGALATQAFADSSPLGSVTSKVNLPVPSLLTPHGSPASGTGGLSSSGAASGALAVVDPLASSSPGSNPSQKNAKADIQQGNAACGFDLPFLPVIGVTNYHRNGNTVSVEYHLKNGRPNSTYFVELWGDFCSFFGNVATITTNSQGVANGNGEVTVPATSTRFFATAFGPDLFNDTPAVTLLP